jgi:hypothetical protein
MIKTKKRLSLVQENGENAELLPQNDDEAEKIERRKSKAQDHRFNLKQISQNEDPNSLVQTKQVAISSTHQSSLTNQQLAELYANCLKLCTENVIILFLSLFFSFFVMED